MKVDSATDRAQVAFKAVHRQLWRALLAYCGSVDVADEAAAEAFAQLIRRGAAVENPEAWVWRSAFRIAAGELQARQRHTDIVGVAEPMASMPEPAVDLLAALGQLTDQQRACVVLCDLQGHTAPSAAQILETSSATVRVQRMRARRRLRELLEEHDEV